MIERLSFGGRHEAVLSAGAQVVLSIPSGACKLSLRPSSTCQNVAPICTKGIQHNQALHT